VYKIYTFDNQASRMELLTPDEVAKLLKVNKRTIYSWVEKKQIPYIKINKKLIRFRPVDIQEFIQNHYVNRSDTDTVVDEILSKINS
jgi:excisionase family DNA binding protein